VINSFSSTLSDMGISRKRQSAGDIFVKNAEC
jgi:hypothetical protein